MSHLYFNEINTSGKTKRWEVTATATDGILGIVCFWGAWRKYIFKPTAATIFDASCLRDIADFTDKETTNWRSEVKERTRTTGGSQ